MVYEVGNRHIENFTSFNYHELSGTIALLVYAILTLTRGITALNVWYLVKNKSIIDIN